MTNKWTDHVKKFSLANGLNFRQSLKSKKCRDAYRQIGGNVCEPPKLQSKSLLCGYTGDIISGEKKLTGKDKCEHILRYYFGWDGKNYDDKLKKIKCLDEWCAEEGTKNINVCSKVGELVKKFGGGNKKTKKRTDHKKSTKKTSTKKSKKRTSKRRTGKRRTK